MNLRQLRSLTAVAFLCFCASTVSGAEKPKEQTFTGKVKLVKDKDKVTGVEFVSKDNVTYKITPDTNARKLMKEEDGAEVEIVGFASKKGDVDMLRVKSYKKAEKPKEGEAQPPGGEAEKK